MSLGGGPIGSDAVSGGNTPSPVVPADDAAATPASDLSLGGLSLGGDVLGGGTPYLAEVAVAPPTVSGLGGLSLGGSDVLGGGLPNIAEPTAPTGLSLSGLSAIGRTGSTMAVRGPALTGARAASRTDGFASAVVLLPLRNTFYQETLYQQTPDAYWRFNETIGSALVVDQTIGHLNLAATAVQLGQPGWTGDDDPAALFNGISVAVATSTAPPHSSRFSVMAAFRTTGSPITHTSVIVSQSLATWSDPVITARRGWTIALLPNGHLQFVGTTAASAVIFQVETTARVDDGAWHFVVCTYDPVVTHHANIYLDGALAATAATILTAPTAAVGRLIIGAVDTSTSSPVAPWIGWIDDVAIFGYVLAAGEVDDLFIARNKRTNDKAAA